MSRFGKWRSSSSSEQFSKESSRRNKTVLGESKEGSQTKGKDLLTSAMWSLNDQCYSSAWPDDRETYSLAVESCLVGKVDFTSKSSSSAWDEKRRVLPIGESKEDFENKEPVQSLKGRCQPKGKAQEESKRCPSRFLCLCRTQLLLLMPNAAFKESLSPPTAADVAVPRNPSSIDQTKNPGSYERLLRAYLGLGRIRTGQEKASQVPFF